MVDSHFTTFLIANNSSRTFPGLKWLFVQSETALLRKIFFDVNGTYLALRFHLELNI